MSAKPTKKRLVRYASLDGIPARRRLSRRVKSMDDDAIDRAIAEDEDAATAATADFWRDAEPVLPEGKAQVTLRIDRDVLDWFKRTGRGYQTRMNAVLRSYMRAKENA